MISTLIPFARPLARSFCSLIFSPALLTMLARALSRAQDHEKAVQVFEFNASISFAFYPYCIRPLLSASHAYVTMNAWPKRSGLLWSLFLLVHHVLSSEAGETSSGTCPGAKTHCSSHGENIYDISYTFLSDSSIYSRFPF